MSDVLKRLGDDAARQEIQVAADLLERIAELLAERFDAEYSFVDKNVVTLDPATGTGTYILAAIRHGLDRVERFKGRGARRSAATTAAHNVHAFELLIGPYAVAHLRLSQLILAEDAPLPADGPHIYLNDTLDSPNAAPPGYLPMQYRQLAEEHRRANVVKQSAPNAHDLPLFVAAGIEIADDEDTDDQ